MDSDMNIAIIKSLVSYIEKLEKDLSLALCEKHIAQHNLEKSKEGRNRDIA